MKTILTPLAAITYRPSENILKIKLLNETEMNLENAKVHFDRIGKLVGYNKYLALVDAQNYLRLDKVAWQYASSNEISKNRVAVAHYNSSLANRLSMIYFIASYKTVMPVKIFSDKGAAVRWLKSKSPT